MHAGRRKYSGRGEPDRQLASAQVLRDVPRRDIDHLDLVCLVDHAGVREAGGLIDLDSDPLKIMEVVRIGRQVLRRRRALTIFGIACDAAKSIVVAAGVLAPASLGFTVLDVIGRQDPRTIVLSTILFNALVVAALLPMALGVGPHYARRPTGPVARDALIAGVCGIGTDRGYSADCVSAGCRRPQVEQRHRHRHQVGQRQPAVALVHRFGEAR